MDIEEYRRGWLARAAEEGRRAEQLEGRLRAALPALTRILVTDFGADAVALIGSVARGETRVDSDLDLVVRGVPGERLLAAGVAIERAADVAVDLIPWESASAELRAVVLAEGTGLYGDFA